MLYIIYYIVIYDVRGINQDNRLRRAKFLRNINNSYCTPSKVPNLNYFQHAINFQC